jgi:phospholipid-translocating ATPase
MIGGVIGTDIIRYDVYGSDVTIANKIESFGIQGSIAVSEDTKTLLEQY